MRVLQNRARKKVTEREPMQAYHIYPDAMMKALPGSVSEEAPVVSLPEKMQKMVREILQKAFYKRL